MPRTPQALKISIYLAVISAVLFALPANAAVPQENVLDGIATRYFEASKLWEGKIGGHAQSLFWYMNIISLAWGLSVQTLQRADVPDIFAEIFRHIMFTGFNFWLLVNGPYFASLIIDSLRKAAGEAIGGSHAISPSSIIDIGLNIAAKALENFTIGSPIDSLAYILVSCIILICLALVAANMLIMLCSGWVLASAGVLFLGFGGGRWTSDIAINYYKTVLSIGASLFTMTLLIGIGLSFMNDLSSAMSSDAPIMEMFVCMITAIVLLLLVDKLPQMVAGITTGALGGGFQGFGAGTGIAAAAMAVGAVGGLAAAAGAASSNIAGGVNAVREAAALADSQMGIGGSPMGEGGGSGSSGGGESGSSSSSAASDSSSGGGSRMSAGWFGQVGKNLAQATSAQAMEGISKRMEAAIEKTFPGKVAERLAEQRAEASQGDTPAEGAEEGSPDSQNSIGGAPAEAAQAPEIESFIQGRK